MKYVTSIIIGKVYSEKLTKLSLVALPDVCSTFRVAGGKWVEPSSSGVCRVSIHLQLTIEKPYIERHFYMTKLSKSSEINLLENFFPWIRSETKWLHWGKECNRPIFSQHCGMVVFNYFLIYFRIKKKNQPWYLPIMEPNYLMV